MKRATIGIVAVVFLMFANLTQGQEQVQDSAARVDVSASQAQNFAVGSFPVGVISDGTHIWVTNLGSNTVAKLQASNGNTLGTFKVGGQPISITFDGSNIWVANSGSNTVSKL